MHLYIHIPFCASFCSYCDFYSVKLLSLREKYVEALCREIASYAKYEGSAADTIYIGGGTPSVLPLGQLRKIIGTVRANFSLSALKEFTIEVNPDDITPEYASGLKSSGINRVSMGVQSFDNAALEWMNRRHNADDAVRAYSILRNAGFENISLDLIFGYSMLTDEAWMKNLEKIAVLAPEHISAYQMSIEPGSLIASMAREGKKVLHSPERCAEQYAMLQQFLSAHGYRQYEISNFAKAEDDGSCRIAIHNSSYWSGEPYRGFGPGAHSYSGILHGQDGIFAIRSWNLPLVKRYCAYFSEIPEHGGFTERKPVSGSERLNAADIFNETVMLGLRTCDGLDLDRLREISPALLEKKGPEMERMLKRSDLLSEGNKIKIPSERLFVSDGIIRDLFI